MAADLLLQTLRDITDLLQSQRLEYALIGGLATTVRGEPRSTLDVDLLVACDVRRCLELIGGLDESPFRPLFAGSSGSRRNGLPSAPRASPDFGQGGFGLGVDGL